MRRRAAAEPKIIIKSRIATEGDELDEREDT